jgi:hypothetical protein
MTTYVPPKKNTAFIVYAGLFQRADSRLLDLTPTLATGDFKVSIDGAATANLATLPTNTPASSGQIKISLSTSEMNGDNITVVGHDAAGAEWNDIIINIQTTARQVDDLAFPATTGRSMVVDAAGLVDANTVKIGATGAGTAQTARDIGASVLLSAGSGTGQLDFTSGVVKANATQFAGQTITAAAGVTLPSSVASPTNITAGTITTATNLTNAPTSGDLTATMKTSVTTAATAATPTAAAVTGAVGSVTGAVGSVTGAVGSVTGAVGSVTGLTASDVGAIKTTIGTAGAGLTALGDTRIAHLDADVSTRSTYAGGDTSGTTTLLSRVTATRAGYLDNLTDLDATISSRLATSGYTAPDNTSVTAIKAKTDSLVFTQTGVIDANVHYVNDIKVNGVGTTLSPWGP